MNFLEQLVADWYAHQGYLVTTNLNFGPRLEGGYTGEIDVLAVRLRDRKLVHIETSSDADSWTKRIERITRKFKDAEQHYETFLGADFSNPKRVAVVSARGKAPNQIPGIEIISINELMTQIKAHVASHDPMKRAIPEGYGLLRAIQFAVWFGETAVPKTNAATD